MWLEHLHFLQEIRGKDRGYVATFIQTGKHVIRRRLSDYFDLVYDRDVIEKEADDRFLTPNAIRFLQQLLFQIEGLATNVAIVKVGASENIFSSPQLDLQAGFDVLANRWIRSKEDAFWLVTVTNLVDINLGIGTACDLSPEVLADISRVLSYLDSHSNTYPPQLVAEFLETGRELIVEILDELECGPINHPAIQKTTLANLLAHLTPTMNVQTLPNDGLQRVDARSYQVELKFNELINDPNKLQTYIYSVIDSVTNPGTGATSISKAYQHELDAFYAILDYARTNGYRDFLANTLITIDRAISSAFETLERDSKKSTNQPVRAALATVREAVELRCQDAYIENRLYHPSEFWQDFLDLATDEYLGHRGKDIDKSSDYAEKYLTLILGKAKVLTDQEFLEFFQSALDTFAAAIKTAENSKNYNISAYLYAVLVRIFSESAAVAELKDGELFQKGEIARSSRTVSSGILYKFRKAHFENEGLRKAQFQYLATGKQHSEFVAATQMTISRQYAEYVIGQRDISAARPACTGLWETLLKRIQDANSGDIPELAANIWAIFEIIDPIAVARTHAVANIKIRDTGNKATRRGTGSTSYAAQVYQQELVNGKSPRDALTISYRKTGRVATDSLPSHESGAFTSRLLPKDCLGCIDTAANLHSKWLGKVDDELKIDFMVDEPEIPNKGEALSYVQGFEDRPSSPRWDATSHALLNEALTVFLGENGLLSSEYVRKGDENLAGLSRYALVFLSYLFVDNNETVWNNYSGGAFERNPRQVFLGKLIEIAASKDTNDELFGLVLEITRNVIRYEYPAADREWFINTLFGTVATGQYSDLLQTKGIKADRFTEILIAFGYKAKASSPSAEDDGVLQENGKMIAAKLVNLVDNWPTSNGAMERRSFVAEAEKGSKKTLLRSLRKQLKNAESYKVRDDAVFIKILNLASLFNIKVEGADKTTSTTYNEVLARLTVIIRGELKTVAMKKLPDVEITTVHMARNKLKEARKTWISTNRSELFQIAIELTKPPIRSLFDLETGQLDVQKSTELTQALRTALQGSQGFTEGRIRSTTPDEALEEVRRKALDALSASQSPNRKAEVAEIIRLLNAADSKSFSKQAANAIISNFNSSSGQSNGNRDSDGSSVGSAILIQQGELEKALSPIIAQALKLSHPSDAIQSIVATLASLDEEGRKKTVKILEETGSLEWIASAVKMEKKVQATVISDLESIDGARADVAGSNKELRKTRIRILRRQEKQMARIEREALLRAGLELEVIKSARRIAEREQERRIAEFERTLRNLQQDFAKCEKAAIEDTSQMLNQKSTERDAIREWLTKTANLLKEPAIAITSTINELEGGVNSAPVHYSHFLPDLSSVLVYSLDGRENEFGLSN